MERKFNHIIRAEAPLCVGNFVLFLSAPRLPVIDILMVAFSIKVHPSTRYGQVGYPLLENMGAG